LIPLLSHWWQRGRCRHCSAPIAHDHILIELGCALAAALLLWLSPQLPTFALVAAAWLLLTLAALDAQHYWLPDRLIWLLALCAVPPILLASGPFWSDRLIGGAAGFGSLWLIGWLFKRMRGVEGLGAGDPKLFGAIGLLIGWQPLPLCMVLACLLALLSIGYGWLRGRGVPAMLPLGSFLAMAAYVMLLIQASAVSPYFG
jgi:leader peptidase (prepilin peptidase)/N-methyltransferase